MFVHLTRVCQSCRISGIVTPLIPVVFCVPTDLVMRAAPSPYRALCAHAVCAVCVCVCVLVALLLFRDCLLQSCTRTRSCDFDRS